MFVVHMPNDDEPLVKRDGKSYNKTCKQRHRISQLSRPATNGTKKQEKKRAKRRCEHTERVRARIKHLLADGVFRRLVN